MTNLYATARSENPSSARRLLTVDKLSVEFPSPNGTLLVASDIGLHVNEGELVALVGESGSGKSITAMAILGLVPKPGEIVAGRVSLGNTDLTALPPRDMNAFRARHIGWVSQTPRASLNPSFSIRSQITAVIAASEPDLPPGRRAARAAELLDPLGFTDPKRVLDAYPHELSGGMCQRVCIAMALAGNPSLLIADEPTTALDVSVQAQILALLRRLNREFGLSILLVTHDLAIVSALAHRTVVLYGGVVQEVGNTDQVLSEPRHPYTQALLQAIPDTSSPQRRLAQLPGHAGPALAGDRGCRFAPRCLQTLPICSHDRPNAISTSNGGFARCHLLTNAAVSR